MEKRLNNGPGAIARFLVRYRVVLFCTILGLAVLFALQIPHTNVNTDMTKYLPDSYPMRQGMDVLEEDLPAMQEQLRTFGSVFADGNDLIPKDLPRALITGFSLACIVLLIMCSSVMEVVLFLITIGLAVALNMGTNSLLPSVSMMTHMLANILQMVLSMDYCIILMNRFRQEKATGLSPVQAMENAVSHASASILSSAFTTIVSLLMLIFMKIKIGVDMGTVLAKGVTISLLCTFTVLPCLIIWFDKAIEKTRKRPPKMSGARNGLARFESKFRVPLAILFVASFGLFFYLQGKTPMSFSPKWNSPATAGGPETNDLLLLYSDADSARIPALLDTLKAADPKVTTVLSYPSLIQRQFTAPEMASFFKEMAGDELPVSEDMLALVYFARSHKTDDDKFSFDELMESVDELREKGLIDRDMDLAGLFGAEETELVQENVGNPGRDDQIGGFIQENDQNHGRDGENDGFVHENSQNPGQDDAIVAQSDSSHVISSGTTVISSGAEGEVEKSQDDGPYTRFTYEQASTPITAAQMAQISGLDKSKISMIYRMAGKAGQAMLPLEFVDFVQANVLNNRRYAAFIPRGADEQLAEIRQELVVALEKGPTEELVADGGGDSTSVISNEDGNAEEENEAAPALSDSGVTDSENPDPVDPDAEPTMIIEVEPEPPTPLERLAEMVFSRHKYSSAKVYRALSRAGVPITQDELDLLYLYTAAKNGTGTGQTMSPEQLLGFVADTLMNDPALAPMLPDSLRTAITSARDSLMTSAQILRGNGFSAAVVMSEYDVESDESFAYIDRTQAYADAALEYPHHWIGGAEMYKELKEGFPSEVLILTLLTVLSIFLIVAITFRSLLIPIPLIMTVLTGIYADIWAVGASGETMYFISFLIIQGILMGATIDYTILFTGFYLRSRKTMSLDDALAASYDGSLHSISTSGLILTLVPFAMSFTMSDPMICSILKSISAGAVTIMLMVLFILPGVIAALDKVIVPAKRRFD